MKTRSACVLFLFFISMVQGCAPSSNLKTVEEKDPLPGDCRPLVFLPVDQLPESYEIIATVKHGDTGLSVHCSKEDIRVKMSAEACSAGANGIVIKKEKKPDLISSCYRVSAVFISYEE